MKSKFWSLISVLVIIGMVLSGCAKPTPTPEPVAKPTAVPAVKPTEAPPAEPIKIAILAPLSGDVKTFGESTRDGALMAFDEWNAKGGVLGRQIEVIIGDSKCDAQEAANAANKVIFEDGVHYIVGEVCSSASIPISEITEAEGVLQISPTSTNPAVTINEDGSNKEYVFRACFLDPFQGEVVAALAMELGAKTSAVLYDVGNDYVKGLAEYYKLAFESMGGTVSVFEAYTKEDTDFSAILTKVAAANPDALFLPDYYSKNNLIAAQIKEKGITAQLLGGDGWDSPELDMPLFEGGYHSNHYSPADPRPLVQNFVKAYTDKYGAEPDALATLAYDAAHILCQAIENAGVDDPAVVKDAMAALQFEGVSGEITFDAHGDPVKKAAIIKVEGGKKVFYKFVAPAAPEAKKYVIATDATWPPMEFVDENKNIVGFDIDLGNAIAAAVGIDFEFKNVSWDGIFAGLEAGEYDAILSCVTITDDRMEVYDFSDPYLNAGQTVVVRADETRISSHEDLSGMTAGAQIGTTGAFAIEGISGATLKEYDTIDLALFDLLNNVIDAVVADAPVAADYALVSEQFKGKLRIAGEAFTDEHLGLVVRKGDTDLVTKFNAGLEKVKASGQYDEFYDEWISGGVAPEKAAFKVGMVTDVGGIDDKSFNATSWKGVADAIANLGVAGQYLESQQQTDYAKNITEFLEQGYDMLVTVGFLLGDDTAKFGAENPDVPFAIVDYAYDPTIPNVLGLVFNTDGAAFLAGYLAAGMTKTGKVGTFGGIEIPPVTIFMVGFESGVKYYNEKHGTNVEVLGTSFYVGNFESTDDGRRAGESLMDEGADIVMPVAGPVGLGTAAAVQERGGMLIGVDTDWYVSAPEYKDIVLTSVLKNMDVAVYTAIESAVKGTFEGGVYVGTLANNGVGIAPFNAFDADVSAELKAELEEIKQDLIDGVIWTGWGEAPETEAAVAPDPGFPVKIAILAPLSGDVKTFGESTRDGALMAFDEATAAGWDIEIIIGDSKCDAQEAANAANKVIFEDGVHYIVGEVCSSASIPISEIAEAEGVLQISPTSTNPAVTINEDGSNKEYVFRACFLDPFQGEVVAALAMELGAKTSAVLYDVGNDYVKGLAEYYKLAFESMGGTVSVFEAYTKEDTDFSAILTKVAAANPDALFLPDYYSKNNLIAAQVQEKGITALLLGGDGWDSPELDMPLFEGGYHSNHYSPADPRPLVQDFVKAYTAKYGAEPDALATLAYDAAHILLQAIAEAGVDDPAAVKDAMAALHFEGVSGEITFDENGDPVKKAAIIKVEGGKKVFYKFVAP